MDSNLEDGRLPVGTGLSQQAAEPEVSALQASIPDADDLRKNAKALRTWFDSVSEQQREDIFWGRYSIERRAADAMDCAFRLASSAVQAMELTANAIDHIAIAMETRQGGDGTAPSHSDDSAGREASPVSSRLSDTEGR